MMPERSLLIIAATFIWVGFVCAISFMEAWLKFQAPGVTLSVGLSIGRIIFSALNKVEWVISLLVIACLLFSDENLKAIPNLLFIIPFVILITQTLWLLPALSERVEMHIRHCPVPPSYLHLYFVTFEVVKVLCLVAFGTLKYTQ